MVRCTPKAELLFYMIDLTRWLKLIKTHCTKFRWWLAGILLLAGHAGFSQSLILSQYYFSPSNLNPAYAGLEKDIFLGANYRSQWRNLQSPYNASVFSVSYPVYVVNPKPQHVGGVAFSVSKEAAGTSGIYSSLQGQLSAAYNLRLDEYRNILVFGLQGSFVQNKIDTDKLQWGSQYDVISGYNPGIAPSLGTLRDQVSYPSFSTGIIWHHTIRETYRRKGFKNHIGLAISNLNHPNTAFFTDYSRRAPLVLKASGGLTYTLQYLQISHQLLWVRSADSYHANFGTYVTYRLTNIYNTDPNSVKLSVGSWYRWKDALVLSTALQTSKINVALSYDFNKTFLHQDIPTGGAYELSVSYRISRKGANSRHYGIPLM